MVVIDRSLKIRGAILLGIVAICWLVLLFDALAPSKYDLRQHGIIPRKPAGLIGIFIGPFIHVNATHCFLNTLGILILGGLLMWRGLKEFIFLTLFVMILGGLSVWCFARYASHLGFSGIVFGWFAYLLVAPFMERPFNFKSLAIAVIAGIVYGALIFGVFSTDPKVSWESHLFGVIWGAVAAVGYWKLYLRWLKPRFMPDKQENFKQFQDEETPPPIGVPEKETPLDHLPPPVSSPSSSRLTSSSSRQVSGEDPNMFGSNNPYYASSPPSASSSRNNSLRANPFAGEPGSEPAWGV